MTAVKFWAARGPQMMKPQIHVEPPAAQTVHLSIYWIEWYNILYIRGPQRMNLNNCDGPLSFDQEVRPIKSFQTNPMI